MAFVDNHMVTLRWLTSLEWVFIAHILIFYGYLISSLGASIKSQCLSYWPCRRLISETFFGYHFDRTDGQWREFRSSLGLMLFTALLNFILMQTLNFYLSHAGVSIEKKKYWRSLLRASLSIVVIVIQHGYHFFIIIALASMGYMISNRTLQWSPTARGAATWGFAIFVLLFKESYRVMNNPMLSFLRPLFDERRYGGLYAWRFPANFLALRILSYSFDHFWFHDEKNQNRIGSRLHVEGVTDDHSTVKDAESNGTSAKSSSVAEVLKASDYSVLHYSSYIIYSPLYMAGPIITFNDFMGYTASPQEEESTMLYGLRFVGCLVLMEYLTHAFPFFAVVHSGLLPRLSIHETAVLCYVLLKIMWMKFMILWKFFRLWAMLDGVLPPENMTKCMSNNYSLEQFWKGWHSSYNKWIVRYIYKPLGGRNSRVWSVWPIFLFVAIWHDMEWKLLAWGLLNSVFYIVEVIVKRMAQSSTILRETVPPELRQILEAIAGAVFIIILVAVNLLGYAVGVGGIATIFHKIATWDGLITLIVTFYFLCMGVTFMNYLRMKGISKAA